MLPIECPQAALYRAGLCTGKMNESRQQRTSTRNNKSALIIGMVNGLFQLRDDFSCMEFTRIDAAIWCGNMTHDRHQFSLHGKNEL